MIAPRKLSVSKFSPDFNKQAALSVDKVFVDGAHLPLCVYYDMDKCVARGRSHDGVWVPMQHGQITVMMK